MEMLGWILFTGFACFVAGLFIGLGVGAVYEERKHAKAKIDEARREIERGAR